MKDVAIIGECMIELNGQPFGEMQQTYGGDTLNTAIYLSRSCEDLSINQPINIQFVTAMGADPLSKGMIERWQDEGINTDLVLIDEKRTAGLYLIQLDEHGERTFLYWRDQSAARYLLQHPNFKQVEHKLESAQMVFISGISMAILPPKDREALLRLLHTLRLKGVEIVFDSNYRQSLWPEDQLKSVKTTYQAVYKTTDLALVTFDDEQQIWGDKTPQDTVDRLHTLGIEKIVVKLGHEGCITSERSNGKRPSKIATTPVSNVVDTTSAGDSFNGAFLSAYLSDAPLTLCCQRGNALAGKVIQHQGAILAKAITSEITKTFK